MPINRYNVQTLKKISKIPHKNRKKHLDKWSVSAFKDIKNICGGICSSKKIPQKTLKKVKSQKNLIRLIANSKPESVKKILVNQTGGAIFTAIAAGLIPVIIDQIVKATT